MSSVRPRCATRLLRILQLAVVWAGLAGAARADDVRAAYLEVREVGPGRYEVVWKTPMKGGARLRLSPRFPDGLLAVPGSYERTVLRDSMIERWELEDLHALATDNLGRAYAAAGDDIYWLGSGGVTRRLAGVGDFGAPIAMAADEAGGVWLVDRKKQRLGRLDPGTETIREVWADPTARLAAIADLRKP